MKTELNSIITAVKTQKELDEKLKGTSEGEIKKFLFKQEPKLRKIHDNMMNVLEKYYDDKNEIAQDSYLNLLILECTYIQSMLCKLYGLPTPAEDLIEEIKNANLQS